MKKPSVSRQARRSGGKAPMSYPLATQEYLRSYVNAERQAGTLFNLEDVTALLNEGTRQALRIAYTAMMESHHAGAAVIQRDIDPLVVQMYKDLERMTSRDGKEYAMDKLRQRYNKAVKDTYRRLKPKGGSANDL